MTDPLVVLELPSLDDEDHLEAAAAWYLKLAPVRSWMARATKVLTKYTTEKGTIATPEGTLGREWAGWEYGSEIADEMPQLGRNVFTFSLPCEVDPHRPLEVLLEAMPEHATEIRKEWSIVTKVDGKLAHNAAEGDGEMSKRVRELRGRKTKLGRV